MDIIASLTSELNVGRGQVEAAVKLIDEGNTIPFIARYRKEATGSLNDEVLRTLDERLRYLRGLEEKKAQVMASIADQGKLTGELKKKIGEARTMVAVDDLYLPYRPKRKTRASMARERGLEPLADWIASQNAGTSLAVSYTHLLSAWTCRSFPDIRLLFRIWSGRPGPSLGRPPERLWSGIWPWDRRPLMPTMVLTISLTGSRRTW